MHRKGALIFIAVLLLVVGLAFVAFNNFVKDFNKGLKTEPTDSVVEIQSPGCFFPDTKKGVNALLGKLQGATNWKVISASDASKNPALKGLLAYRVFDGKGKILKEDVDGYVELDTAVTKLTMYKVALVDVSKSKHQISVASEFGYKLTSVMCDQKKFNLSIHSTFKFGMQSCLLFRNGTIGLVVFEMGYDPQRVFTQEALKTVSGEISALK